MIEYPIFQNLGLYIQHDPLPDGFCQFGAISDQLRHFGIERSPDTLRMEVILYSLSMVMRDTGSFNCPKPR